MDRAARAPDPRAEEATPRPWRMSPLSPESRSAWIYAGPTHPYGPHTIAALACADAALIVRTVNSHDALLAACEYVLEHEALSPTGRGLLMGAIAKAHRADTDDRAPAAEGDVP